LKTDILNQIQFRIEIYITRDQSKGKKGARNGHYSGGQERDIILGIQSITTE
jgi:hypothetical protein